MKRGVKAITGKREIMVGVWENFKVSAWYADTPMNDRNEASEKWALYYLEKGKAPKRVLEKEIGHFRFKQEAVGHNFIIVAYSYEPELDNESAIHITVVSNEKPDILSIKLSDIKSNPIKSPMSYGQMVNAHVNTVGMNEHHKVVISLWEDNGDCHKLIEEKSEFVGENGVVHAQFRLPSNFQKIVNSQTGKGDTKTSFYITAFALGELTSSAAIKMKAEGKKPVLPDECKKITEDHLKGRKQPKEDNPPYKGKVKKEKANETPKDNIPTNKPKTFPTVVKGGIKNVFFIDENWKAITQQKNNRLRIYIVSEGIVGKQVKLQLWEDDKSFLSNDANDLLDTKIFEITANTCYHDITLTKAMQDKGAELGEGWSQELFVQIHVIDFHPNVKSAELQVDIKSRNIDVPDGTSITKVGKSDADKHDKSTCPRCTAPITATDLKKIFTDAENATLTDAASTYTKYMKDLGMDTCWNKAHFFAQAVVESGLRLKVKEGENFNWYYPSLISTFGAFKTDKGKKKAKLWGREKLKPKHPGVSPENEKNIANWAYSPDSDMGKMLGNTEQNDGWDFRGKGLIQLTGRSAYEYANTYTKKEGSDIVSNPDLVCSVWSEIQHFQIKFFLQNLCFFLFV